MGGGSLQTMSGQIHLLASVYAEEIPLYPTAYLMVERGPPARKKGEWILFLLL